MADYKKMYFDLLSDVSKAINILHGTRDKTLQMYAKSLPIHDITKEDSDEDIVNNEMICKK